MKRRFLSATLIIVLLAGVLPAAQADSDGLFPVTRAYEDQFSDVSAADWYYENVRALYELGLINGQGSGTVFAPDRDTTIAEALTVAARLRSLYEYGDSEAGPAQYDSGVWYLPYVSYLQSLRVIGEEFDGGYSQKASRAQMAHILANALPQRLFDPINEEMVAVGYANGGYISDVSSATPYSQDILKLYTWGILGGMDQTGSFHPDKNIPRCQMAVMVTRLACRDLRVELAWESFYSRAGTTMADLVYSDGIFYDSPSPDAQQEIESDVRYMLSRGERTISLRYPSNTLTKSAVSDLLNAFLGTVRRFVEQTYNEVQCSYSVKTGTVTLSFSSSLYDDDQIEYYRDATMARAIEVHDRLWEDGSITAGMTEYEKARVYFTWICEHCRYDFASANTSMSHSGYQAFSDGLAVCDGYTAAYNLLLKLEGISCTTVSAKEHIWTAAELDGIVYHIDTTWGDQTSAIAYQYFGMTEADALARFR